jgi:O-acetyl-ADP-ribose deacetylase (regulator of RNase III)
VILSVKVGDVLDECADVLICSANPWLNLSGGVNGALLLRGGQAVQDELKAYLQHAGRAAVEAGTVIRTGPGALSVTHILHAVAIDPFYGSSVALVQKTIETALEIAQSLAAHTVASPMLATGFGPLGAEQFATALAAVVQRDWAPVERLTVVVRRDEDAEIVRRVVAGCSEVTAQVPPFPPRFRAGRMPGMGTAIAIFGVTFASICIWLTVRIINRRERWAKWTLAMVIGVPVIYVASFGPACWLTSQVYIGRKAVTPHRILIAYLPIIRTIEKDPGGRFKHWLLWWMTVGTPKGQMTMVQTDAAATEFIVVDPVECLILIASSIDGQFEQQTEDERADTTGGTP